MAIDICCLESRYGVPFFAYSCDLAKVLKSLKQVCCFEVFLDQIKESDISSLIEVFSIISLSEIEAVDFLHKAPYALSNKKFVLSLIRLVGQKARIVDLRDVSCGKDFRRDLFQGGLSCQVLHLGSWRTRKLNITGKFMQLHTLNLDFSISLTGFTKECFNCMPNLARLSLCETRITNLWTTSAALSKLPSLKEIRFQNCLCCSDTRQCPTSTRGKAISFAVDGYNSDMLQSHLSICSPSKGRNDFIYQRIDSPTRDDMFYDAFSDDDSYVGHHLIESTSDESSDESEVNFPMLCEGPVEWEARLVNALAELTGFGKKHGPTVKTSLSSFSDKSVFRSMAGENHSLWNGEFISETVDVISGMDEKGAMHRIHENDTFEEIRVLDGNSREHLNGCYCITRVPNSGSNNCSTIAVDDQQLEEGPSFETNVSTHEVANKKYKSHHPSPICFEKHYREYIITSIPHLKVLDNLCITDSEREKAKLVFSRHFEYLPYNRRCKENVINILQRRESGGSAGGKRSLKLNRPDPAIGRNTVSFTRSLSAAKVGSAVWPSSHSMSKFKCTDSEEIKAFRPRQFEYHPSDPSLMVFGTLDGELVIINLESSKVVGYVPSVGALNSVLGLCWLKKYPSKLIAGSDNGVLQLYDVNRMGSTISDRAHQTDPATYTFEEFEQLTSVHVNSTDEYFLTSGNTKHVALYDIVSGKRLQTYEDLHEGHINVVKFAHYSPSIFATSSFDHEIKMWDLRQRPLHPCYTTSSTRGNVMVCFSPDDRYLLSSAVDNEVRQHLAVDGRLHLKLDIATLGSVHNYTRSYYMSGGDYIISGSCEESVVRVCCAQTGRRLRDIPLEAAGSRNSRFVQSLRGDPFRAFHMSILAAYVRPSTSSEIIQVSVNLSG
ncbi:DNA damage-binding protein 2 [Nymphaea thermarum]|nr:DNA damage-binding protein 2 [Nymphaea thermarum]